MNVQRNCYIRSNLIIVILIYCCFSERIIIILTNYTHIWVQAHLSFGIRQKITNITLFKIVIGNNGYTYEKKMKLEFIKTFARTSMLKLC